MNSRYGLNLKIEKIVETAKDMGIDLTKKDLRTIFLYELGKLQMMSMRVFLIIHDFGREKFCREPQKYGLIKIGGELFILVHNIPQVLADRVFENGAWGMPKKEKAVKVGKSNPMIAFSNIDG